jgi:hypothetical protein
MFLTHHSKSKQSTGREFIVAQFLPHRAARVLFLYLVYIRPFAELLCQEQGSFHTWPDPARDILFQSLLHGQCWSTARFHQLLTAATRKVWCHPVHPHWYRQISIAVAEKHVRGAHAFINQLNDKSPHADPDVAFAWQSGHRPVQRAQTYSLDSAFPTKLQPALLHAYAQVSHMWHCFLHLDRATAPP